MRRKPAPRRKRISATTAARSFSRILDAIERGHTFRVHRHGRDVCTMTPVATERKLSGCLAILRSGPEVRLDDQFADDLNGILRGEGKETTRP